MRINVGDRVLVTNLAGADGSGILRPREYLGLEGVVDKVVNTWARVVIAGEETYMWPMACLRRIPASLEEIIADLESEKE